MFIRLTAVRWLPSMRDGQGICTTEQDETLFAATPARSGTLAYMVRSVPQWKNPWTIKKITYH